MSRDLLTKLTELRESAASQLIDSGERAGLENVLGSTLRTISARAEAYPELTLLSGTGGTAQPG